MHVAEGLVYLGLSVHSLAPVPRSGRWQEASMLAGSENMLWAMWVCVLCVVNPAPGNSVRRHGSLLHACVTSSSQIFAQWSLHVSSFSTNDIFSEKPSLTTHLKEPPPYLFPVTVITPCFRAWTILIVWVCLACLPHWNVSSVGQGLCLPLSLLRPLYPAQCFMEMVWVRTCCTSGRVSLQCGRPTLCQQDGSAFPHVGAIGGAPHTEAVKITPCLSASRELERN